MCAGTFLYVALFDVLVEEFPPASATPPPGGRWFRALKGLCVIAGFIAMTVILELSHSHGHEHAAVAALDSASSSSTSPLSDSGPAPPRLH